MGRHWKYVLGIGLGVALLGLFLYNTDLPAFGRAMRAARPGDLGIALVLTLASYALRTIRWHYLVRPVGKARFWNLFEGIVIGFMVSSILPGRLGEVVRPYIVSTRDKIRMSALIATVVVDRLCDMFAVLVLLAVYLVFGLDPAHSSPELAGWIGKLKLAGVVSLGAFVLGLTVLAALRFKTAAALRIAALLMRPVPERFRARLLHVLEHFASGLSVLSDLRSLIWAVFWSLVVWVEIAVSHYLVIRAFDIELPFVAMFLLLALMVIGVSIPTPGGMGGLQLTCQWGITLVSFPQAAKPVIDAASMAVWGNSFLPVTVVGLILFSRTGLSFARIQKLGDGGGDGAGGEP
ncbi:MAG: lysylphosphatidylglycerol synthase transmembrane domain-containing protein [Acidobacteriota bacterium]